jgi:nicotinate-nucleotide pyrophosphorylase (carboxylating)
LKNLSLAFCLSAYPSLSQCFYVESLNADEVRQAVKAALSEDVGTGDVTTEALIPANAVGKVVMTGREPLIVAGLALADAVFRELAPDIEISHFSEDGDHVKPGQPLRKIKGAARAILTGERVALNFVQRLSGVATLTGQFVEAIKGTRSQILDTRKTTPGWRRFEKYAVVCGGGGNHRFGLFDMVLIKDNHLATLEMKGTNSIATALERAKAACPKMKIEIEADTLEQVDQAIAAGADLILLDNMNPVQLRLAVQKCKDRAKTEASGGVNLATVRTIAEAGVDFISVGALTHSARAVDIGLDFET